MKNILKTVLICALLLSVFSFFVKAQSIKVHSEDYKQTIDMIGGDMERSSKAIQSAENKQEILEWCYEDIEFNVCRVQYDKNQELVEGTKNWDFYTKQIATMKSIKDINPDIKFFATMRSDYDGYGDENNLPDWIIDYDTKVMERAKYGVFLADYCEYMSQQGVPISIISTTKEWMWHVRAEKVPDILASFYAELDDRNIARPVISDQGFWSISQGLTYLNHVEELGTIDLYHSFCSHNYAKEEPEKWVELIEKAASMGKVVYDDETSAGNGSPTYGVERAMFKPILEYVKKAERYEAGLSGEVFFENWSRGLDNETRAIYFPAGGTGTRLRGYYLMKHFSNNILNSQYVTSTITSLEKVYTIQFRKDDKLVLWVINKNTTEYPLVPISVDANKIVGDINVHYWTDSTTIEGSTATFKANGNLFETSLHGESINCFIFNVQDNPENLALSATATQSSTESDAEASRAIDNNTNGLLENASVSQTTSEENPWWQLDLGANDTIGMITIFNRSDACCNDVLDNFTLTVLDADQNIVFTQTETTVPDPSVSIDAGNVIGQYVKIQLNATNNLSLAEVQVMKGSILSKMDQVITFPPLNTMAYTTSLFSPGASANSNLIVEYTSSNHDVAIIEDNRIKLMGVGSTTITASRPASQTYNAAAIVEQSLTVTKADQKITFQDLPLKKLGDPSFLPPAEASSGLAVDCSSSNTIVATTESGRIYIVGVGSSTITVSQAGDDKYNAASEVSKTLTVEEAEEEIDPYVTTLSPIVDTYVRGGTYEGEIFKDETDLEIKNSDNDDYVRWAFLKFDIYDVDEFESATLRLYATSVGTSQVVAYATTDTWDEGTISYTNAPSKGTSYGSNVVTVKDKYYEWDVTDYIRLEAAGDNIVSIVLADIATEKKTIRFNSSEATSNPPQLVIQEEVPISSVSRELENNRACTAYPNPANNLVFLENNNIIENVIVTTIDGREVMRLNSVNNKRISIKIDDLSNGLYLFHVIDEEGFGHTLKVLIE